MKPPPDPPQPAQASIDRAALDRIFGLSLPENTKDDLDPPGGDGSLSDDWYRTNRPPHHGG